MYRFCVYVITVALLSRRAWAKMLRLKTLSQSGDGQGDRA